jgi:hypothetical protein
MSTEASPDTPILAGRVLIDGGSVDVDFSDCTFYPTYTQKRSPLGQVRHSGGVISLTAVHVDVQQSAVQSAITNVFMALAFYWLVLLAWLNSLAAYPGGIRHAPPDFLPSYTCP